LTARANFLISRVLGRQLEQVLLQAAGVVVERDGPAVGRLVREERLEVYYLRAGQRAHLAPVFVERALARADEPVEAAVEDVVAALPRRAQAAGAGVHLEDARRVTVHPAVTPGRQARDAGAYNGDGLFGHVYSFVSS